MQNKVVKSMPSTRIRAILPQKINSIKINNKQMLRDLITDFVIQNLAISNHITGRRKKQMRYQPLAVSLNLNGCKRQMQFELFSILERYLQQDKQHTDYKLKGVQATILDLLDFFDKMEKDAQFCMVDVEGPTSATKILDTMITKHSKKRQQVLFEGQFEEAKQNIYAKYKKMSCNDVDSISNGSRVWRDFQQEQCQPNQGIKSKNTISILEKDEFNHKKKPLPIKSKLKQLIESCNIFQQPERVDALRQQKLVNYFCKNEKELMDARYEIRNKIMYDQKMKNVGHMAALQDWIAEISLSEYLFKKKYEPKVEKRGEKDEKQMLIEDINSSEDYIK